MFLCIRSVKSFNSGAGEHPEFYWTGRITTKDGAVYEFGNGDIVKGSGYITSQCCGSTEIEIGTVYAAEMGLALLSEIDRYTLQSRY